MTTYVYIDALFFENFFIDLFLIYAVCAVWGKKFGFLRGIFSAGLGAAYVCAVYTLPWGFMRGTMPKIITLTGMMFIAFKMKSVSDFMKYLFTYMAANFILAGGIYFTLGFVPQGRLTGNSVAVGIFFGILFIAVMGRGIFMLIGNALKKKELTADIILFYNGKTFRLRAFSDTGNSLVDPISRLPVVIISKSKIEDAVTAPSISKIKNFRLIPCRTASGKYDLLYGFKPDKLIYENRETQAVAAISKEDFYDLGYDAVINPLTLV